MPPRKPRPPEEYKPEPSLVNSLTGATCCGTCGHPCKPTWREMNDPPSHSRPVLARNKRTRHPCIVWWWKPGAIGNGEAHWRRFHDDERAQHLFRDTEYHWSELP